MNKILSILRLISLWLIGIFAICLGFAGLFQSYTLSSKILVILFIILSFLLLPPIHGKIKLKVKPIYFISLYAIVFVSAILVDSGKAPVKSKNIKKYVTANELNVRQGSGSNYKVLYTLERGDTVSVLSDSLGWSEISTTKGLGVVSNQYISESNPLVKKRFGWILYIVLGATFLFTILITFFKPSYSSSSSRADSSYESSGKKQTIKPEVINKLKKNPIKQTSKTDKQTKPVEEKLICKFCGTKGYSVSALTHGSCSNSPTKKHEVFEKGIQPEYICKYCGTKNYSLSALTLASCQNSPTKKHQPFEGGIQKQYVCKYCGHKSYTISSLTLGSCINSPNKKHQPLFKI